MRNGASLMLSQIEQGPKSVSVGTGVHLSGTVYPGQSSPAYAIVGMNDTQAIAAFRDTTAGVEVRVALVEKVGTSVAVHDTGTGGEAYGCVDVCKITDTTALVVYNIDGTHRANGFVVTLNANNTLTIGSSVEIYTTGCYELRCTYMGNNRVLVVYESNSGWGCHARVLVVSGNTFTMPMSDVLVDAENSIGYSVCSMSNTEALLCSAVQSNKYGYIRGITLNGDDTLTVHSPTNYKQNVETRKSQIIRINENRAVVAYYYNSGGVDGGVTVQSISYSGNVVSLESNEKILKNAIVEPLALTLFTDEDMIVCYDRVAWVKDGNPFEMNEAPNVHTFYGLARLTDQYGLAMSNGTGESLIHLITLA